MEIKFIGTGGAFDHEYYNSSALLTRNDETYLIDCGNRIYSRLCELDMADKINHLLITHTHDDHIGSLASLILHQNIITRSKDPLILYYPSLEFKMTLLNYLSFAFRPVEEYVRLVPLDEVDFIKAIDTKGLHVEWMQTWGYIFEDGDETIAYSGDLGNENTVFNHLDHLKKTSATVFHELIFKKGIDNHSYYKKLEKQLDKHKIFGYHCNPNEKPSDCKIPLVAEQKDLLLG